VTGFTLNTRDVDRLRTVDFRLAVVVARAAETYTGVFTVAQARRTVEQQRRLVEAGKSETMHSLHLVGRAVDLVIVTPHGADWRWHSYVILADVMHHAGLEVGHPVFWGGDWRSIKDGDHWQLTSHDPEPLQAWPDGLSSTSFTQKDWSADPSTTAAQPQKATS
jgi:peptidoglycan L-alanyl-D-glutamate endopeptidase CwlK